MYVCMCAVRFGPPIASLTPVTAKAADGVLGLNANPHCALHSGVPIGLVARQWGLAFVQTSIRYGQKTAAVVESGTRRCARGGG